MLPSGRVLIAGGAVNLPAEVMPDNFFVNFIPLTSNFRVDERPTSTLLPHGKVLITGGVDLFQNSQKTTDLYTP